MNEPKECIEITQRFFQVLDELKSLKRIRGYQTFTRQYGVNRWNFITCKKDNQRIKQEWLAYLVRDFNVSPTWLLTGNGKMFNK